MSKFWIYILGGTLGWTAALSKAEQQPRLISAQTSAPTAPDASTVNYRVECSTRQFTLTLDLHRQNARWSTPDAGETDISATPLGQRLLTKRLFGHLGFTCWGKGVNVSFLGLNVRDANSSDPVTYTGFLGANGEVRLLGDVSAMPLSILNQIWNDEPR